MSVTVFVKDYIKSVAGKVLIFGLILLLLTEKMSHDTQAVLSIQPYHYGGMSIKSLCYGIVWTVYYK